MRLRNVSVSRQYEPGSLFKVLLAAATLESDKYRPGMTANCTGTTMVGGRPLHCWGHWAYDGGHGVCDLTGMLVQSCNITAAHFATLIGAQHYCSFLRSVGIGQPLQAGMPGEASGSLRDPSQLRVRDLANMGFGQGVSVTDIQMANAVSAVVNGGELMQPHIAKSVLDARTGSTVREVAPQVVRRVCSERTSAQLRYMLGQVVDRPNGTGRVARIPGVSVGGKTGTAQKWVKEAEPSSTGRTRSPSSWSRLWTSRVS